MNLTTASFDYAERMVLTLGPRPLAVLIHDYPMVRQALAYSFGLDSQDFVVAYETDDLVAFGDLVRALRSTESRRSTLNDTPILLGIHRPLDEILSLLGAS